MTAQELYDEIKAVLKYFGLSFSEMDQVKVTASEGTFTFAHGNMTFTIKVPGT